MRKRLFAALRWIELPSAAASSKVAERDPDEEYSAHEDASAYTQAELAARMGAEEWFLAYEMNGSGILWGDEDETTTYSLSFSPEGSIRVRCYDMQPNPKNGKPVTVETDSKTGTWSIAQRALTLWFPEESLVFIVARIEEGVAMLVDADDGSLSVFMTESALNAESSAGI